MTALHEPRTATPAPRAHTGRRTLGILFVIAGLVWLGERVGIIEVAPGVILPLMVAAVGFTLMISAFDGADHGGLVVLGVFLALATLADALVGAIPPFDGVGDRSFEPTTTVESEYRLGAGELLVDLTSLDRIGTVPIEVRVGFGKATVLVPTAMAVEVTGSAEMGSVDLFGDRQDGIGVDQTAEWPGLGQPETTIELDVSVFAGEVIVEVAGE